MTSHERVERESVRLKDIRAGDVVLRRWTQDGTGFEYAEVERKWPAIGEIPGQTINGEQANATLTIADAGTPDALQGVMVDLTIAKIGSNARPTIKVRLADLRAALNDLYGKE